MKFATTVRLFGAATVASLLMAPAAQADSGFYLGAGVGDVNITQDFGIDEFDENATAWKVMGGYIFDLPVVDFGVELAYNDFGSADQDIGFNNIEYDAKGVSAFGMAGLEFGIFGAFLKAGFVQWDVDIAIDNISAGSDDGTDPAYGIGFRLGFSSVEVRAEYELFDVSDADDVDMISLGLIWRF